MKKGFTLLELLVVVAIIGILAGLVTIGFPGAFKSARDGKRREEIGQYRVLLEVYANRSGGAYPVLAAGSVAGLCGAGRPLGNITCPVDPKNGTSSCYGGANCRYSYVSDGVTYVLWSTLEKPADNTKPCSAICSSGLVGDVACSAIISAACPL